MTWIDHVFEGSAESMSEIPDGIAQTCVTSPPYWNLRDYGIDGQLGFEDTPEEFVDRLVGILMEVHRILADDGTLWLNLGDKYYGGGGSTGHTEQSVNGYRTTSSYGAAKGITSKHPLFKPKDLIGIPWRVALKLQERGWWLRSDVIWAKPNPMPESIQDRPARAHEYLFMLTKSERYHYDIDAVRMPQKSRGIKHEGKSGYRSDHPSKGSIKERKLHPLGKNLSSVWTVSASRYSGAHFATFPEKLIEPCILASSRPGDTVLDPFMGSGTTALVALKHRRHFTGYELNPDYHELIQKRIDPYMNQSRLSIEPPPTLISGASPSETGGPSGDGGSF